MMLDAPPEDTVAGLRERALLSAHIVPAGFSNPTRWGQSLTGRTGQQYVRRRLRSGP
jgi:hypothetical protein